MAKKSAPLPLHLEELIGLLEAQTTPDRLAAIREVEAKHGVSIDLNAALEEHDELAERYGRWRGRIDMGLEDQMLTAGMTGKASPTTIMRGRGQLGRGDRRGAGDDGNGRLVLGREHRGAVEAHRKGW